MSKALEPTSNNPRWLQRFEYYETVFLELQGEVEEANAREFSNTEKKGLVKTFEILCELAWQTLRDLLEQEGVATKLPKPIIAEASTHGVIPPATAQALTNAITKRNETAHAYDTQAFNDLFVLIQESYYHAFAELYAALKAYREKHAEEVPL